MRAWLLLVLAVLAVPFTAGQTLPTPCSITIPTDPAVPAPIAPGGSVDVSVDVQIGGQTPATVTVTGSTTSAGWSVLTSPDPQQIANGNTGSFLFTIRSTREAVAQATVQFVASATCDIGAGGIPCPLPVGCDSAPDPQPVNTQVGLSLQAPTGFQFPGLGSIRPEILIAGIILIGLATAIPFVLRRKKGAVVADCPEPLKMIRAGRGTSFPIEIRNNAKDAATAQFEVGPVPEGWSAFMPLPEVQLAAREARSLWLMVRSPATAAIGDAVDVELRLKDPKSNGNGHVVRVRAEVQAGEAGAAPS